MSSQPSGVRALHGGTGGHDVTVEAAIVPTSSCASAAPSSVARLESLDRAGALRADGAEPNSPLVTDKASWELDRRETAMLVVYCPRHEREVLLGHRQILGIHGRGRQLTVRWQCWCGHRDQLRP